MWEAVWVGMCVCRMVYVLYVQCDMCTTGVSVCVSVMAILRVQSACICIR